MGCAICADGYYGPQCEKSCPTTCAGAASCKSDGTCNRCKDGQRYGMHCETPCPSSCGLKSCDQNGNCRGCTVGTCGLHCEQKCGAECMEPCVDTDHAMCSCQCSPGSTAAYCTNVCQDRDECKEAALEAAKEVDCAVCLAEKFKSWLDCRMCVVALAKLSMTCCMCYLPGLCGATHEVLSIVV